MAPEEDAPVEIPIGDSFDLHFFAPADVPAVVEEYLIAARAGGFTQVRLIHGRGRGVQRARVLAQLAALPWVVAAREAPADLGGWGATIVELAPAEGEDTTAPA